MKKTWFKEWGWIYRPISAAGWFITIVIAIFCLQIFLVVDRRSHSVSDTFYSIFPFVVPAFGIWNWIASKSSKKPENPTA
jgi:hypothetical protein